MESCPLLAPDELARCDRDQTAMVPMNMEGLYSWTLCEYEVRENTPKVDLRPREETRLRIGPELLRTLPAALVPSNHSTELG